MAREFFQRNVEIRINSITYRLVRQLADGVWQLEETRTGRIHELSQHELEEHLRNNQLSFVKEEISKLSIASLDSTKVTAMRPIPSDKDWEQAKIRRAYAKAVEDLACTETLMVQAIKNVWEKIRQPLIIPHWTTVYRWKRKYLDYGNDVFSLLDQNENKGNRSDRHSNAVIDIVHNTIESIYLTRERKTIEETYLIALAKVDRENQQLPASLHLSRPTRRLIKRCIRDFDAFEICSARFGYTAAIKRFRAKLGHTITNHPLEVAEIDHTKLDIFVIDENGIPLGRPWLTVMIDVNTRCILGLYIGFEPPSYTSVARCLKHAILPKSGLKIEFGDIQNEWCAYGIVLKIKVDNGLEFHSKAFEMACYALGIDIEFMPRKKAWLKGHIERFMRTINHGVLHGIKGTSFANIFEKDDYDPSKHAVLTLQQLRWVINKWIVDFYHQRPHRGLDNISPQAKWQSSISPSEIPLTDDFSRIDILLGKLFDGKKLTHKGIEINSLLYNSPDLVDLRRKFGEDLIVSIRVDEGDLGHLWVQIPETNEFIEVNALNYEYAKGLSLWQHKIIRRYAKNNLNRDDPLHWAKALLDIREKIDDEINGKHRKTNARIARFREASKYQKTINDFTVPTVYTPIECVSNNSTDSSPITRPRFKALVEQRGKV